MAYNLDSIKEVNYESKYTNENYDTIINNNNLSISQNYDNNSNYNTINPITLNTPNEYALNYNNNNENLNNMQPQFPNLDPIQNSNSQINSNHLNYYNPQISHQFVPIPANAAYYKDNIQYIPIRTYENQNEICRYRTNTK